MHMRQGTMKIKQDMINKHAETQAKMFERDTGTGDKQMTDYHRKHWGQETETKLEQTGHETEITQS